MNPEVVLYHVGPLSRLDSILQHGLDGARTTVRPGFLHLSCCPIQAMGYDGQWSGPCVLISMKARDLPDHSMLGPDREDLADMLDQEGDERRWNELDAEESLETCGQCTYEGVIPVSALTVEGFQHEQGGGLGGSVHSPGWLDTSSRPGTWAMNVGHVIHIGNDGSIGPCPWKEWTGQGGVRHPWYPR